MQHILNIKTKKIITYIFLSLVLLVFILLITPKSFQNDTLFDIKLGEKYINSRTYYSR